MCGVFFVLFYYHNGLKQITLCSSSLYPLSCAYVLCVAAHLCSYIVSSAGCWRSLPLAQVPRGERAEFSLRHGSFFSAQSGKQTLLHCTNLLERVPAVAATKSSNPTGQEVYTACQFYEGFAEGVWRVVTGVGGRGKFTPQINH